MNDAIIDQLGELGVIPVIVLDDAEGAVPLAEALLNAGMPALEIAFRTDATADALGRISRRFPDLLLGAGTVLTVDQARQAGERGARFIISPGLDAEVVEFCLDRGLVPLPGVSSPTEIQAALRLGVDVLKLFPMEALGGLEYLKAVSAPFPKVRFIPTGGVNTANLADYLTFPRVLACAGTWIARRQWLAEKRFDLIEREAARVVRTVAEVRQGGDRA